MTDRVGAGIVEVITESLYDNPIVVFREYVQNSADALSLVENEQNKSDLLIDIWKNDKNLYFLDNGCGIEANSFKRKMSSIADSVKNRSENIGYKGIGRLSGLSYCRKLSFINIIDFEKHDFQKFVIDCSLYMGLRKNGELNKINFSELMGKISNVENVDEQDVLSILGDRAGIFTKRNSGFLVVMEDISHVLETTINKKDFIQNLSWLLPVPFDEELMVSNNADNYDVLFSDLSKEKAFGAKSNIPAKAYRIRYEQHMLTRPIGRDLLRKYFCKSNLEQYAVCIHTFSNKGIAIESKNTFSGIRIYIDNILLCNETELIPALKRFGFLSHTVSETIQAVRGIGAIIYIVDKINLSTNARRTFIDVTDKESLDFLELISKYVENVFQARYALSGYFSAKKKMDCQQDVLNSLKQNALDALIKLASQDISLDDDCEPQFENLKDHEKKRLIKNKITKGINSRIKDYLEQVNEINLETCYDDFVTWLKA